MHSYKKKVALFLVFINCVVFIAAAIESKNRQIEKKDIQYFSDALVKYEFQKKYTEVMGFESNDKIKKSPYIFLQDLHFWTKLEKEELKSENTKYNDDFKDKRLRILLLKNRYEKSISYNWGLNPQKVDLSYWWSFLTYQFLHIDFAHFFMNVIFLFLVVIVLNQFVSDRLIFVIYILGGVGAGLFFMSLLKSPLDSFALVGASGSISALMMYLVLERGRLGMPWTYFWSLDKSTMGVIYMPAYVLFILFLAKDFALVIYDMALKSTSTVDSTVSSTVAYSAHVGGALTGIILYIIVYLLNKKKQIKV